MNKYFGLFFALIFVIILFGGNGRFATAAPTNQPNITVQAEAIQFSWQLPSAQVLTNNGKTAVSMQGLDTIAETGLPQLPTKSFLLALPQGANPELVVETVQEEERPYSGSLAIVPQPSGVLRNANGEAIGGDYVAAIPKPFVKPVAVLEEIGEMRGVRMARLTIYPVRPEDDRLRITQAIELRIDLNIPTALARVAAPTSSDSITGMIGATVINPQHVQKEATSARFSSVQALQANPDTAVIAVNQVGITAVTYADLVAIGFPVESVDPHKLHLMRGDEEVALEWVGDGDSQFESNEQFKFYAAPWFSRWMHEDVYLLSEEGINGLRVANVNVPNSGGEQRFEENKIYTPDCICAPIPAGRDGDRWVWDDLRKPGRPSNTYSLPLSNFNAGIASELTLWMIGFTAVSANPDHKVNVTLNGTNLGNITWDGKTAVTQTLAIPANTLQANNELQLSLTGSSSIDGVWLDAAQIDYTHQTAPTNPVHSPASLRMITPLSGAVGADYILIAPQSFMSKVGPLVALRQAQGLQVVTEDVQAIYDHFGYGRSTPEAIHDYLEYAYHNWTPQPEFVLLVGDGNYDPKQYKDDSKATIIPPYLAVVDPWIGEVAADNRFVTVDGDDILPDMAIGRLPVNSDAEVEIVINKITAYETNPHFGDWNSKIVAVTDDEDSAGDFADFSDTLLNQFFNDPWQATKSYYDPAPGATNEEKEALKNQTHTAVLSGWNQGRGMVMFNGHSSIHQWAAERLFHLDDVANLNNNGRLPVVLQMTCFTGSFHMPFWDTMDEGLIRRENGGAVATWGPTGLGVATGHDALAEGFLNNIITNGTPELGRAAMAGKLDVMSNAAAHLDLIDTFTLLGDPATRYDYDFWAGYGIYLPVVTK